MKKLVNALKTYKPSKPIVLLYFFVPIFVCVIMSTKVNREQDIYFLLNHGKYVLQHGFPTIEPFSMHQGFSFVMQQWLSAVIFYSVFHLFGKYGLWVLINLVNLLIIYIIYKLCMKLSSGKYRLSILLSCISDILLQLNFITVRPQIFTYINLLLVIYILESFYQNKNSKLIYFLPLVALLQINLHASMFFMLFLFMLPFIVEFIICKIKDKTDNRVFKVLILIVIMTLIALLNPYGIKNIKYVFTSYGNFYINNSVVEMVPPSLTTQLQSINCCFYVCYITMFIILSFYIIYKKGNLTIRYFLLFFGVCFLAIIQVRNYALLILGGIPPLAMYFNSKGLYTDKKMIWTKKQVINYVVILFVFLSVIAIAVTTRKIDFSNPLKGGIDKILANTKKEDIILYTGYNDGSYAEYRGLKPYIDTRAEVFLKANNKRKDIMKEYYEVSNNLLDYKKFLNKYKFTHLLVTIDCPFEKYLSTNKDYRIIYENKKDNPYKVYEKITNK